MKKIVVLSGKGGAGKTSVTAVLAQLAAEDSSVGRIMVADADVDAANLELLLFPHKIGVTEFWGGQIAIIDQEKCMGCGDCVQACRFDAVRLHNGNYHIDKLTCEGCAACKYRCPEDAITMQPQQAGEWYRSDSRYGPLIHAYLRPAQENSGKLVSTVKQAAIEFGKAGEYSLLLVDGPPGIGCPVISAITGMDLALIVTEPTASGLHDLKRILKTIGHFKIPALVCINKADLYQRGAEDIKTYCGEYGIEIVGEIPFDMAMVEAMVQGQPVTEYQPDALASNALRDIWGRVRSEIAQQ
jgi:MinD superfamily P-loop ATPase